MNLGLCLIQAFNADDKVRFQKDFGLNVNSLQTDGTKIGEKVGVAMAQQCPAVVVRMSSSVKEKHGTASGTITKIETDNFVIFSLKDKDGASSKYLWLDQIESKLDLPNTYPSLLGKNLTIKFEIQDIFDPKIGEYRRFKVVKGIQ